MNRLIVIDFLERLLKPTAAHLLIYQMGDSKIYLTFDDGPTPDVTPKVIKILKRFSIQATFFMEGQKIEKYPEIVKLMAREGHSLCYHTYSHKRLPELSWSDLKEEYSRMKLFYDNGFLTSDKYLRPPYGKLSTKLMIFCLLSGIKLVMWTLDSKDSHGVSGERIVESFREQKVNPGSIILFHDDSKVTADTLEAILTVLIGRRYAFGKF